MEVEIGAELFKECEDGFTEDGKSVAYFKKGRALAIAPLSN